MQRNVSNRDAKNSVWAREYGFVGTIVGVIVWVSVWVSMCGCWCVGMWRRGVANKCVTTKCVFLVTASTELRRCVKVATVSTHRKHQRNKAPPNHWGVCLLLPLMDGPLPSIVLIAQIITTLPT